MEERLLHTLPALMLCFLICVIGVFLKSFFGHLKLPVKPFFLYQIKDTQCFFHVFKLNHLFFQHNKHNIYIFFKAERNFTKCIYFLIALFELQIITLFATTLRKSSVCDTVNLFRTTFQLMAILVMCAHYGIVLQGNI